MGFHMIQIKNCDCLAMFFEEKVEIDISTQTRIYF